MKKLLLATAAVAALSFNTMAVNAQQSGPASTGGTPAPSAQPGGPAGGSNTTVPGPNTAGSSTQKSDDGTKSPDVRASEKAGSGSSAQGNTASPPGSAQHGDSRTGTQPNRNPQQGAQQQGAPQQSTTQRSGQNAPETTGSVGGGANITTEQRTQVTKSFTSVNVQPVTNVSFNVSSGTVVPEAIELHTLPPEIVRVVPAWRTYRYVLVRNQIVIIEPGTRKIVTVIERSA